MSISYEELVAWAEAERDACGRTIQYADKDKWEGPSPCAGWTNWDVVSHMAGQEVPAAALFADEPAVELAAYREEVAPEPLGIDAFNAMTVGARYHATLLATISEWGTAADVVLAHAAKLDEEGASRTVEWFGQQITLADLLQQRTAEWWLHGEDIRAGMELPVRGQHRPIWLTNDYAIRSIPRTLSQTGQEYWGLSVRVDLEGIGGGRWNQRLSSGPEPDPTRRPDVVIEAAGHAFALVVGRRISADVFLENGQMRLGGNEEIAYAILEHIRTWP